MQGAYARQSSMGYLFTTTFHIVHFFVACVEISFRGRGLLNLWREISQCQVGGGVCWNEITSSSAMITGIYVWRSSVRNGMRCYRRALGIPYVDHVAKENVLERVNQQRLLRGKIQSHKLRYFGHIARHPSPQNDIALGYMPGTRRQGGQRRQWVNDITDWAELSLPEVVTLAKDRCESRQIVHNSGFQTFLTTDPYSPQA